MDESFFFEISSNKRTTKSKLNFSLLEEEGAPTDHQEVDYLVFERKLMEHRKKLKKVTKSLNFW